LEGSKLSVRELFADLLDVKAPIDGDGSQNRQNAKPLKSPGDGENRPCRPSVAHATTPANRAESPQSPLSPSTGWKTHFEDVSEYLIERSAIAEYEGGLSRQEADKLAIQRAIIKFKLKDDQGGGTYISQTTSVEEALERLREFYGDRLEEVSGQSGGEGNPTFQSQDLIHPANV
jgi:hypothetical protein